MDFHSASSLKEQSADRHVASLGRVNVPPRSASKNCRKTAKGIFPNAEVMRGPHWKWKNDDGKIIYIIRGSNTICL
jgi:hypothetical protein